MASRKERLNNLLKVQRQLTAVHEMRHAGFVAQARAAEADAAEMMARADGASSLSDLFPDIYARGIARALDRGRENAAKALAQAGRVATETARTNMVAQSYREFQRQEDRDVQDKERLEAIQRSRRR
jgi:hypothetical protein